ncbi:hypothetical protein SDC9_174397 [bioreactor metagenome]|uniref:Uncharacterized protein n=1 Tax=bioreactor metagenome TaxID=1076179 RepID=A0A645GLD5_9ZZZZ
MPELMPDDVLNRALRLWFLQYDEKEHYNAPVPWQADVGSF